MATNMAIQTNKQEDRIDVFMRKAETIEKFEQVLGRNAKPFISSVLILVNSDAKLQECSTMSVYKSALRAASLELSCDPALKQAWIIPYDNNIGTHDNPKWVKEAQFQPHYNGLRLLAERTGKYWVINVSPVYKGERVIQDRLTGLHSIVLESGLVTAPPQVSQIKAGKMDVTDGTRELERIGYLGYYKTKSGIERTVWMTLKEIDTHAREFVKGYLDKNGSVKNPNWKNPAKRPTMEMKTVLRQLLSTADLSGKESAKLADALNADTEPEPEIVDGSSEDIPNADLHPMTYEEACQVVAMVNGKEKPMSELTKEQLTNMFENSMLSVNVEAAKIILKHTYNVDPKPAEKKSVDQLQKELGFK